MLFQSWFNVATLYQTKENVETTLMTSFRECLLVVNTYVIILALADHVIDKK